MFICQLTVATCHSYLKTLDDLEGFIECQNCDAVIVGGDFNVDIDCDGQNSKPLDDYIMELKLHVCDLDLATHINEMTVKFVPGEARYYI